MLTKEILLRFSRDCDMHTDTEEALARMVTSHPDTYMEVYEASPERNLFSSQAVEIIAIIGRCLANGQKINAIKELRAHSQLGLKDAKDIIDLFPIKNIY